MAEALLPTNELVVIRLMDDLTTEDDQWLWEIVEHMNSHFAAAPLLDKVALAREVVLSLVEVGSVELWRGELVAGPVAPLSSMDLDRLRQDDIPWHSPQLTDLHVVIRLPGTPK